VNGKRSNKVTMQLCCVDQIYTTLIWCKVESLDCYLGLFHFNTCCVQTIQHRWILAY
jgi:hypothetical protein